MKIKPIHVFCCLCIAFLGFSFSIYLRPLSLTKYKGVDSVKASEGRLVWQKYNCQCCHQLYGLGGYLGPDLTNEYGKFSGNTDALKALFKNGFKQMPIYSLSQKEEKLLIEFLKETDASGSSDPRNYKFLKNGMIEQNGTK
jgi:nitric oxide reductase subunit C